MKKRKTIATQIAEHFGCDIADVRGYDYQPGRWNRKVYLGMDGNNYWSAGGATPPKHRDGGVIIWKSVQSNWFGNQNLWVGTCEEDSE